MKKRICIIGTGGMAKDTYWIMGEAGLDSSVECFIEPDEVWVERNLFDKPVRKQSEFNAGIHAAVIAVNNGELREKIITQQLPDDTEYVSVIHPAIKISSWTKIGRGAIISAGSIITHDIQIGDFPVIYHNCAISHDCIIGNYFTCNPGAIISGNCTIGDFVKCGTNCAVREGIIICDNVLIGMGSNVVKSISLPGTYAGNPARLLSK